MKLSKKLITLLSVAAVGLSSTVAMGQSSGFGTIDDKVDDQLQQQLQQRLRAHLGDFELSDELREAVEAFREQRTVLMEQFRALREAHRAEMAELWMALRTAKVAEDPDAIAEAEKAIRAQIEQFRAENGTEIEGLREARHALRDAKRQLREQIREQLPPVDEPEG